ncbi:MAG: peptide deformylase [bacterium]|nr:peptide deformylase [bacterium]
MISIVQKTDPVLRKVAKEVPEKSINSPKIAAILGQMKTALDSQEDGVAIAAPQIGESLRIFVVSERALDVPEKVSERRLQIKETGKHYGHIVFINPVMTKISKDKAMMEEGCLSVRYAYGKVQRAKKASVKARNEKGEIFTRGAKGLLAQIFQHEIDHLDGILFIDKAIDVKEIPPEQQVTTDN